MITQGFIDQKGYKGLRNYKYKSGEWTWLDGKMNYFWQWCIRLMPLSIAPNLITFTGWVFVILSYACMMFYDYTFKQIIPSWCFYFASVCIFIYSTLDAIDGKQARRTGSGSPLGQLFDHGCDSFSMTFFILAVCQALRPTSQQVFLIYFACQASFYISNWMEYKTGVLQTAVGQFGVTEAEFTCALIHLATGIFGQELWDLTIFDYRLGAIFAYFYSAMIGALCLYSFISTLWKNKGQRIRCIGELFGLAMIMLMELIWLKTQIYNKYNGIILVNFGILTSLLVCKIIICSVTKMKYQYFHNQLIVFLISTMIMIVLDLKGNVEGMVTVFWGCFFINISSIIRFIYRVIVQITLFLGIYCFSLEKRPALKDTKND